MRSSLLASALFALLFSPVAVAQGSPATATATSDPQAITLAKRALLALTGTTQIADVTLTGTATRIAGSDVGSGPVTLKALGAGESRLDLNLSNGTRSEVRNLANGSGGSWVGPDGIAHAIVNHNCLTDAGWFFPAFSAISQLSNPNFVVTYVGQETRAGTTVQHLHVLVQNSAAAADPGAVLLQSLSAEDLYLDTFSFLPVSITFNTHPDDNALTNIPVEIRFFNYQTVGGAAAPLRIQKFLNGTLFLDITVESVVLNSGLSNADFNTE